MRRAFALGLTTGIVYFTGTLYWIARVMVLYGGLHQGVAILVNAALIAYLSIYPAIFAMVMRRLVSVSGAAGLMAAPLAWVATELGRADLFTGFPWVLLGYSQTGVLPIAQLASLFGVYGVSALVAGVSAALSVLAVSPANRLRRGSGDPPKLHATADEGRDRYARFVPGGVMVVILLTVAVWGSVRVANGALTRSGEAIRVGLVQGNVDQGLKWNVARASSIFQDHVRMTQQAMREGAELVLWPESSTPFYFEENRAGADELRTLARQARVPILLGSDQIERGAPSRYYNAAFLVGEDGSVAGVYRKMHLVPFGEYVPLKQLFFFAAPLVEAVSDYSAGEHPVLLDLRGHLISTAICYEIVYPKLIRRFVRGGSELLTTMTNDAWFGPTSAPHQHFEQASMRAIEYGRYLVRSANTGISGIVDPYGRVLEKTAIFEPSVTIGEARFLQTLTIYARIGDVFAYASVVLTIAALVLARRRVQ